MANEENLIPNNKRSPSEVRENGRKGGIKSGQTRRRKKTMKQAMNALLSLPAQGNSREALINLGIDPDDADNQMLVMVAMMQKAVKGNVSAAQFIASIAGGYDENKQRLKMEKELNNARIEQIKAQTDKLTGNNIEIEDMEEMDDIIYGNKEEKNNTV